MDVTFKNWLLQFVHFDSRIGQLARYAYCDSQFPNTRSFNPIRLHLSQNIENGFHFVNEFEDAYKEYRHSTTFIFYLE